MYTLPTPWPPISKNECTGQKVQHPREIIRRQRTTQGHSKCYCFSLHPLQRLLHWSLFFLLCMCMYAPTCVLMLTCVQCAYYPYVHVHMRPEVITGCHSSELSTFFFETGPLIGLVLTGAPGSTSSTPGWQVCPAVPAPMLAWRTSPSAPSPQLSPLLCRQHLHVLLSNSSHLMFAHFCLCVRLPWFPQIRPLFTFLSSLSMNRKLSEFCSLEWILGLVLHIPLFFCFSNSSKNNHKLSLPWVAITLMKGNADFPVFTFFPSISLD